MGRACFRSYVPIVVLSKRRLVSFRLTAQSPIVNDDTSHLMYEHVTPDEAAGLQEGTVPKIGGYEGAIETSTEVKMAKARTDLLRYLVERWSRYIPLILGHLLIVSPN